jgi:hypothetical protein
MSEQEIKEIKSFDDFVVMFHRALDRFQTPGTKFKFDIEVTKPSDTQFLESRIKELVEENKRLIEHIKYVHERMISFGSQGMDMFSHTSLRDEYYKIIENDRK